MPSKAQNKYSLRQVQQIVEKTADIWDIDSQGIYSKSRTTELCDARDACILIIKEKSGMPNPQIGAIMGMRLPSAIHHSLKRTKERIESARYPDRSFIAKVEKAWQLCQDI